MSYQTRSRRTDALLLDALRGHGLDVQEVDPREHHPHFQVRLCGGGLRLSARRYLCQSRSITTKQTTPRRRPT